MKILRIGLLAFGPFTDKILDLNKGHEGLHIVYGPNEAGKTSALRALRQLFYGIPERSSDGFIHPYAKLRIGGKLLKSDGAVLEFVRRKGRVNTLRARDDATLIDESQLHMFLGGVDSDLFATMFGIDHADLVQGGEEIIQGGGDVGQVLFAAGSGISDLRKVQDELRAEAESLFKPRGQTQRINEALATLKKNKKALREAELPGREWVRHDMALSEALDHKKFIVRDLGQKQRKQNRLERIRDALPAISQQKELLNDLKMCADAVLLPADFGDRRRDALTNLRIVENDKTQAGQNLKEINKALEELAIPEYLIENADLIEQLHQDLGSQRKAMKDRSELLIQRNSLEADATAILRELRDDLTLDQAGQLRLSKSESVRIQGLGNTHEKLATKMESAGEEISKYSLKIEYLKKSLAGFEDLRDTSDLSSAIEHARQHGALEEHFQTECTEIQLAEQVAEVVLKRQQLWAGNLEDLEKLPVPLLETIDVFEHRLNEAQGEVTKHRAEIDELECTMVELDGKIEQLRLEQEVPTEDDLLKARRRREEGWQLVLQAWKERHEQGVDERDFIADFQPANDLAGAYELSVQHADELADRLRREADRVANKATLLADRKTRKNQCERLKDMVKTAEIELAKIEKEWSAVWEAVRISPKSPREMRVWTQDQRALADQVSTMRERKAKVGVLKALIETHCKELSECLVTLGEPAAYADETLLHLIERGQKVVDHMARIKSEHEQVVRDLEQKGNDLREAKSRAKKTEQDLLQWQSEWTKAIQFLGLESDAEPAQAISVIEDIKALSVKIKEAKERGQRIDGIDRDAKAFAWKVSDLTGREAPDLSGFPVEQAVAEFNARLTRARKAKTQQQGLEQQGKQEQKKLRIAEDRIARIHAQLATMCQEARCKNHEDLPAAEERSTGRQQIQTQLEQLEEQIRKLSGGATLDEFIQDARSVDPDGIDPVVDRLGEEIEQLDRQKSDLDQTIGSERTELSKMDGSARAAGLAEEGQGLLARLETDAEQYVRLRLASTVLSQAIERYREKNQGPILKRSTDIFARMTLGSFEGLRLEFRERGDAVLVGVRPGGKEIVGVEGMSDGTADQLYLAVRLAGLETYLERNEAMPFIVDDILIKFDDDRAVATLQVLAQLAERTQIIFFTHHRHLVELAEAHIDGDMLFEHSL
ncbi:MAG: AAA family ATPase [Thermodesulfobacteriota bacterium]|nr:AAA family ATPase [Thermodesulfobacteriota bacterium]